VYVMVSSLNRDNGGYYEFGDFSNLKPCFLSVEI
jgi:hypothetical protein